MSKQIRVGVVFGGKSGEHEVSIQSARSILGSLNPQKYIAIPIGISKTGRWNLGQSAVQLLYGAETETLPSLPPALTASDSDGELVPSDPKASSDAVEAQGSFVPSGLTEQLDVVMPVLHGSFGEDGTIQGMFELLDVPYVGAGVLASAVGMDKVFMKRVYAAAGLPQVNYSYTTRARIDADIDEVAAEIEAELGYPCFVKPANLGSSVGISKAKDREGLISALKTAAKYDRKVIIEEGLDVREIEVAVLGNDNPKASVPGEVVPSNEFYDYNAKYIDGESQLIIPANLSPELTENIRQLAVQAFLALDCSGLGRVDFFIEKETNRVLVNEINTMPGFTEFSMYPKLWEATGVSYQELIDQLISLAIERHQDKQRNITDFRA